MYQAVLLDSSLYGLLLKIDEDLAAQTGRSPCRFCGARLHSGCYTRKPRGIPEAVVLSPGFDVCFSFCCGAEGCRRRQRSPSVRFLGPKVYLGVLVALLSAMRQGTTPRTARQLRAVFGADRRTLARWRSWWQQVFPRSTFWREKRSRLMPPVDEADLPQSLVARFVGVNHLLDRVILALRFLSAALGVF